MELIRELESDIKFQDICYDFYAKKIALSD